MRKIISVITVIALMLSGFVFAKAVYDDRPSFEAVSKEASVGDAVYVPLRLNNNPGITAFRFTVEYSSDDLELTNITYCSLFSNEISQINRAKNPLTVSWFSTASEDEYDCGQIAVLEFRVLPGAKDSNITIEYSETDVFDSSFEIKSFDVINGRVTVLSDELLSSEDPSMTEPSTTLPPITEPSTTMVCPTEPSINEPPSTTEQPMTEDMNTTNEPDSYICGDVDGDSSVSSADARLVLRAAVQLEKLSGFELVLADADEDGTISAADARKILRCAVSLEAFDKKEKNRDECLKSLLCTGYWYDFSLQALYYTEMIFYPDGTFDEYVPMENEYMKLIREGTYTVSDGRIFCYEDSANGGSMYGNYFYYNSDGDYCRTELKNILEQEYIDMFHFYDRIDVKKFFAEYEYLTDGTPISDADMPFWCPPADYSVQRYDMSFAE
ncbi:MAG: hypothetical protein IJO68_06360 [Clostridia bacterium]|nr:hypothetical protein [Clostridia bacterium]